MSTNGEILTCNRTCRGAGTARTGRVFSLITIEVLPFGGISGQKAGAHHAVLNNFSVLKL